MAGTYNFVQWEDGSTENPRTINLHADTVKTATYARAMANISGVVKNQNGTISGVTVSLNGYYATTGDDGFYQFTDLNPQSYTVTISKVGYPTTSTTVDASAGGAITFDLYFSMPTPLEVQPVAFVSVLFPRSSLIPPMRTVRSHFPKILQKTWVHFELSVLRKLRKI